MKTTFTVSFIICLLSCRSAYADNMHTVSWFMWHKKEADVAFDRCNNNPGLILSDPECLNVLEAKRKDGFLQSTRNYEGSLRNTKDGREMIEKSNTWLPTYWNNDHVNRAGVIGQCDHPGQGWADPPAEECAAARQSARQEPDALQ